MRRLLSTVVLVLVLAGLGAYIYFDLSKQPETTEAAKEKVFPGIKFDEIGEMTVKSKTGDATTLARNDDGTWRMVAPAATKANETDVAAIGAALSNLELTRVIEDKATDLAPYGLDTPQMEVGYKSKDGKTAGTVLVGHTTTTGASLYAKRGDQPRVFLIASYEEAILNKSTFDLRDKTVLSFEREKVDSIEIVADGKTIDLAKDGSNWKLTRPLTERADAASVSSLMDRVDMTQMKSAVGSDPTPADLKKYGLDKPAATVTIGQGSARATLVLGAKADDKTVYARDAAKPLVVTVDNTILDDIKKGADNFRRKDLFDFRPFNATVVEFTRGGQTVAFERVKAKDVPDKWRRIKPNPADVDANKVETLLGDFADLHIASFVEGAAKTGLETPVLVVDAKFGDDNKEEKTRFGMVGSDVFARAGDATPGKVDAERYKDVIMRLDELAK